MNNWKDPEFQKEYDRNRYQLNKKKRQQQNKERQDSIKNAIDEYKIKNGCSRCSEKDPICLDFHHLDPAFKEIEVGNACRRGWSLEKIFKEIEKCILLCANCHRKEHAKL